MRLLTKGVYSYFDGRIFILDISKLHTTTTNYVVVVKDV